MAVATRNGGDVAPATDVVAREKDATNGYAPVRSMTLLLVLDCPLLELPNNDFVAI